MLSKYWIETKCRSPQSRFCANDSFVAAATGDLAAQTFFVAQKSQSPSYKDQAVHKNLVHVLEDSFEKDCVSIHDTLHQQMISMETSEIPDNYLVRWT